MRKTILLPLYFVALLIAAAPGALMAQDTASAQKGDWDISLGAGAMAAPTFEGSNVYRVLPVPLVNIVYKDMLSLGPNGLSAYWRVGDLRVGGGLVYDTGRSDHKDSSLFTSGDDRLRGMGTIDAAIGLKAFASYRLGHVETNASLTKFTGNDNDGVLANVGISLPLKLTDKLTLTPHAGTTWANKDYMETFFGVSATQAANTGFARHDTNAGFKDVRAGLDANYRFDEHWFLSVRTDVKRLVGDAADSPISFADTSITAATMVGYRF